MLNEPALGPCISDEDRDHISRRDATVQALDVRLSVWGQASRDAVGRRAEVLARGAVMYVERVGRNASVLRSLPIDPRVALLGTDVDALGLVAASLLPDAVAHSCRLLWVDPDRLEQRIMQALALPMEGARTEIRRRQALYRRRARLRQDDIRRLNGLRDEIESLRVPRCPNFAAERIARGLLERHREDARLAIVPPTESVPRAKLRVRAGSIARWISQLDHELAEGPQSAESRA